MNARESQQFLHTSNLKYHHAWTEIVPHIIGGRRGLHNDLQFRAFIKEGERRRVCVGRWKNILALNSLNVSSLANLKAA